MMRNNTRPCYVKTTDKLDVSVKAYFHRWVDFQTVLEPSFLKGGSPGGQVSRVFALVEYEDGQVDEVAPDSIIFDIVPEWCDSEIELPNDPDKLVLCIAHGVVASNIFLTGAYELATYNEEDGWILEDWPEVRELKVSWWRPLPEPPGEVTEV